MNPRRDSTRGGRIAGTVLLAAPMLDVVLGGAFGAVHVVVGMAGLALLVPSTLATEA